MTPEELKKLRTDYAAKMAEAKAKLAELQQGKAKGDEVEKLLGEADVIKVQIDLAEKVAAGEEYMNGTEGPKAAHLGWRPAAPNEGMPPVDAKEWRSVDVVDGYGRKSEFRFFVPLAVRSKDYAPAFEAYLRKGLTNMGPNDKKTLSEGVDTAGGFLVPEDAQTQMIKRVAAAAVIRPNARVIQTSRDVVKWPRINYSTDDIYTSGVRLTWTGETPSSATVHRVTDPVFGEIRVDVHTAMASMPLTNSLLEDSAFDVWGVGTDLMGEAFALGEDDRFINGSGTGQPMGLLTQANGGAGPAGVHSGSAGALTYGGFLAIYYGLPAQYRRNAKWLMSSDGMLHAEELVDTNGRPVMTSLLNGSLASGQIDTIKGKPILADEFMPAVSAGNLPIVFGDLTGYYIIDRVGMSVQRLSELYAENDITLLLARKRVGGYCVEPFRMRVQEIAA